MAINGAMTAITTSDQRWRRRHQKKNTSGKMTMQNGPDKALRANTQISKSFHRQWVGGDATATKKAASAR